MEKSGVVGIMAKPRRESRTMVAAFIGWGQASRDFNAHPWPFAIYFINPCQAAN